MIYLDYNATAPLIPEALHEMQETARLCWGNPSSAHQLGQTARRKLEDCRRRMASALACAPEEIVFTSGGTESLNLALFGAAHAQPRKKNIVASPVEHPAVLNVLECLQHGGHEITFLRVDQNGKLDLDHLRSVLREDTLLVALMLANNETGVIFPVGEAARISAEKEVPLYTDAVQAVGKMEINLKELQVATLALSAHKFGGPKGVGVLFVRSGTRLSGIQKGGHQEHSLRAGTENLPAIAGMARAFEISCAECPAESARLAKLRDDFENSIADLNPIIVGKNVSRLCNTSMMIFPKMEGESIVTRLDMQGVAISTGAACASAQKTPSHVLTAMGYSAVEAARAIRCSLGKSTASEELRTVAKLLREVIG